MHTVAKNRRRFVWTSTVAFLLVALAAPAQAQIYSWRDANGTLVLSNHRPGEAAPVKSYSVPQTTAVRTTRYAALERSRMYDELIAEHARLNGVRTDLVRAVVQVESAFNPYAKSAKGAMGLMQLMPATARETAGKVGTAYRVTGLTNDPDYNLLLGSAYFSNLLDAWGGNHVLSVASYNAGAGNVRRWIRENGDPRMPGVDVVEWIESIPIYETRNYVKRVLANAVVYEHLQPQRAEMPSTNTLSAFLGKNRPG